jgi:hypothetical protein
MLRHWKPIGLWSSLLVAASVAACTADEGEVAAPDVSSNGRGGGAGASGAAGKAGAATNGGAGGSAGGGAAGATSGAAGAAGSIQIDPGQGSKLVVEPASFVLDVSGTPKTAVFVAKTDDGKPAQAVKWEVSDVAVGTIGADGTFTSKGTHSGSTTVTARSGDKVATASITVRVALLDEPTPLTADQKTKLDAGGTADASMRWLYPYDKTIFPRGLPAPVLQLAGTAGDAFLVRLAVGEFSFKGYYAASGSGQLHLPEAAWQALTKSAGSGQSVAVEVTKISGDQVTGPVSESWRIAQGSLAGNVYYNSYNSTLNGNGAVLRIKPGQDAELVSEKGQCVVCHSVSAKGNVFVTGINWADKDDPDDAPGNPVESGSFDLAADGSVKQRYKSSLGRRFSFGALTPDGTYMLSNGVPETGSPVRGLSATPDRPAPSKVYDTSTGAEVPATGLDLEIAMTPVFAVGGDRVAFNFYDGDRQGKVLSVMSFDGTMSPPAFSNRIDLITEPERGVAAWPSFLPDGQGVVYHDGNRFDTERSGDSESRAHLRLVDIATKSVKKLAALNGYAGEECTLPGGAQEDCALAFEPSVLPVPVGGYYWVYFTSRRTYGTIIGNEVDEFAEKSKRKKLWVAAIDVDWQSKEDPSHPAFYLPGQELEAGNMRAFAALEPCKADGSSCESGGDCCGGFCSQTGTSEGGEPILQCQPPVVGTCSQVGNACKTSGDCCGVNAGTTCIAGQCAVKTPG